MKTGRQRKGEKERENVRILVCVSAVLRGSVFMYVCVYEYII